MTKLFTALLGTETNTFSTLPTGMQLFEESCLYRNGSYGDRVPFYAVPLTVWRSRAQANGWQVVESLAAFATPAGKTVKSVYEQFRSEILADLEAAMPVDAVMLSLHGAMVAEGYDDAEGDLLHHVRRTVGPHVPIGAVLDLHANVGTGKFDNITAMVLFKEYPHTDIAERAQEVFDIITSAMSKETNPVMAWFDCRTAGLFHTTRQPMRGFVDKCATLEGKDGILSVSVIHGFPWADVSDMGSKILVVADGDKSKAEELAEQLGLEFFNMRKETQPNYTTLEQAMQRASAHNNSKPLILADVSDNSGGGAGSDSTFILEAMLKNEISSAAIGMFWDPMAVRIACEAGEGAEIDIRLGGKLSPASGNPLDLRATVTAVKRNAVISLYGTYRSVGDMVALDVGGIGVVCCTRRTQCSSIECFTNVGIDPATRKIVVVKSMQHFHAAFSPLADDILYVAAPGALYPNFTELTYLNASKNQWPFVENPFDSAVASRKPVCAVR